MVLNRSINIHDDRELAEDVWIGEIDGKGLDFSETFWQVHRGYVKSLQGADALVTDREIFNIVDNIIRHEDVDNIIRRVAVIHVKRIAA